MAYKTISPEPVVEGGTGADTLTGVLTGNGTSPVTANTVTQYTVLLGDASNGVSIAGSGEAGDTNDLLAASAGINLSFFSGFLAC